MTKRIFFSAVLLFCFLGAAPTSRPVYTKNLQGTLVKIEGTSLIVRILGHTVEWEEGEVQTSNKTALTIDDQPATLGELEPGMDIVVVISHLKRDLTPQHIYAAAGSVSGVIADVKDHALTLSIRDGHGHTDQAAVTFDDKTEISFSPVMHDGVLTPAKSATPADLKPDMCVRIRPTSGTAKTITILPVMN